MSPPRVLDDDEVDECRAADGLVHEPLVAADAVLDVDDVVAGREAPEVLEEGPARIAGLAALLSPVRARAEDLLLRDEHQPVGREDDPARERADDDLDVP